VPRPEKDILNDQMRMFVKEYVNTGNAKQSAIRAGYSKKGAHVQASRLLRMTAVKAEITKFRLKPAKDSGVSIDRILNGFCSIAFNEKEKSADRNKALENLAKYMGMFNHKQQIEISDGGKNKEYKAMFDSMTIEEKIKWLNNREQNEKKKIANNTDTDLIEGEIIGEEE